MTITDVPTVRMYVRYLGDGVCWTTEQGNFVMGERSELTDDERRMCESGGGYVPLTQAVHILAR